LAADPLTGSRAGVLGLSGYHWLVIAAGWAGWGFDVYDAVLFNFVAPECIPQLLGLAPGSAAARAAVLDWTGAITSILLIGWAGGGVLFGWIADRIGRKHALFVTIALYAVGTAACALAGNIWELVVCRALASLGIGGEWGIGATLVAEAVPENRRVEAGVILQTASPLGVVLAAAVNYQITGVWFLGQPLLAWRYVFLAGLLPAVVAVGVRALLHESALWQASRAAGARGSSPRELFAPGLRAATLGALFAAVVAILTWWACNAFIPSLGASLAAEQARHAGLAPAATRALQAAWKTHASNAFNLGGLLGTFAAIPLARLLGRRPTFVAYFLWSALALFVTFGPSLPPEPRLAMLSLVGAGVFGIFGAFVFYLPELFPARLRATGAGFCYNAGRVIAAVAPFGVGLLSAARGGSSAALMQVLFWVGVVPLAAAVAAGFLLVETRGRALPA
jgi:MFS family permease